MRADSPRAAVCRNPYLWSSHVGWELEAQEDECLGGRNSQKILLTKHCRSQARMFLISRHPRLDLHYSGLRATSLHFELLPYHHH